MRGLGDLAVPREDAGKLYCQLSKREKAELWGQIRLDAIEMSQRYPHQALCGPCIINLHDLCAGCRCRYCEGSRPIPPS